MRFVLDASALLAYLENKRTGPRVRDTLLKAKAGQAEVFMSVVNWGEAYYAFLRNHGEEVSSEIFSGVARIPVILVEADRKRAESAGALRVRTGLPYADTYAATLAVEKKARLLTSDSDFERVKDLVRLVRLQ